jgi:hypothetical protein
LEKIHVGLVFIVLEELGGLLEADVAGGAGVIHVPFAGNVLLEDAGFVGHFVGEYRILGLGQP